MKTKKEIEELAYKARRKYQEEETEKRGGMSMDIMLEAMKLEVGFIEGFTICQNLYVRDKFVKW